MNPITSKVKATYETPRHNRTRFRFESSRHQVSMGASIQRRGDPFGSPPVTDP
jgi:hypothetical protein